MGFEQDSANPMNSARRKLLRGSVSVPTIMTLSSGAAMANGSTIRCFNNATWLPDPNTYSVRGVQRYTKTISGVVYYYIKRSDLESRASSDGFVIGSFFTSPSGTSAYIRIDGAAFTGTPTLESGKSVGLRFDYNPAATTGQRFKATGMFTTGSSNHSGGSGNVMYGSCWTSCAGIK